MFVRTVFWGADASGSVSDVTCSKWFGGWTAVDGITAKRKMPDAMAGAPGKSGQQYTA
jgi:hypothetical protein